MTSVAELSTDTQDLLRRAVETSDHLEADDPLDKTISTMARAYIIADGKNDPEELAEGGAETSPEAKKKQNEIREDILDHL